MVIFNYSEKQISAKIVYYGPGLGGKTTSLSYLHDILDPKDRGEMLSLATDADRTLYFDFLPVSLGKINDILNIKLQLYTVPGQIRYNNTRRVVLSGADAIVFVADSQKERYDANIESYKNMKINLLSNQINPDSIPIVIQYNKRDLPNLISIEELEKTLNERNVPHFPTIATTGVGVIEAFHEIGTLLIKHIAQKYKVKIQSLKDDTFNVKEIPQENTEKFQKLVEQDDDTDNKPIPMSLDLTKDDDFDFGAIDDKLEEENDGYSDISAYPSAYHSEDPELISDDTDGINDSINENEDYTLFPPKDGNLSSVLDKLIDDSIDIIKRQSEILDTLLNISKQIKK